MEVVQDIDVWEKAIEASLDIIGTIDRNGFFVSINKACRHILGYEKEEVVGHHFSSFIHPDDLAATLETTKDIQSRSKVIKFENRCIHKKEHEVFVLWSVIGSEDKEVMLCIGRDVTDQKLAKQREELHRVFVEQGTDILATFDERLNFLHCGASVIRELGYQPEELIGTNALSYIHPDDIPKVKESLYETLVSQGKIIVYDFRFKDSKGEWRWLETRGSNQLHNPAVQALVTSSRDITERINYELKLQQSEQRFKSLFDNHLDIALYQNKEGIITDVNPATTSFLEISKEDIINRPVSDFLTSDVVPFHEEMLWNALSGKSVRFEASLSFKEKGLVTFDISKIPVVVSGETVGVYSILRDITDIKQYNTTIRKQAEKLNSIMESIRDAFFTIDKNWQVTYANSEFNRLLHTDREQLIGSIIWRVLPQEVHEEFYKQFSCALKADKAVHFDTYFEKHNIWLRVKAFPSEEGLSVSFDDVTDKMRSRQELEKLSLVAKKTTNGVVIKNANGVIEWVNEGFTNITGYLPAEIIGKNPASLLVGEETDVAAVERLQEKRKQGKPCHEEILFYKKSGEKVWVLVDSTPIFNDCGEVVRYVTIQTDITEKKEAEASQLRLTKDLYRQNKDLQQFTYIVSHNLRSPVANTMGLVDVLSMVDKESNDFNTSLAYLRKSVRQLDTVLKDLNMILTIRDRGDTIDRQLIPLMLVLEQVMEDSKDSLNACGGEVSMYVDQGLNVHGDKAYLYSVFHNLLSNAIKYRSAKRALKISIKCVTSTASGTIISFSDNGSGFDMKLAGDKIFKLYKRFHSNSDGRGIGLYLVKSHLLAMGGHIEVTSEVNVGTRFLIYLK